MTLRAIRTTRCFRVLLSDGRVVDVLDHNFDSDVRGALLDAVKAEQIVGSTCLSDDLVLDLNGGTS